MLVRSSECYMKAAEYGRKNHTGGYDWFMHGRPDMAWYADVIQPTRLHADAVSVRAREIWVDKRSPRAAATLSDDQLS